jgi:CRISPR-associated protein Csd1
MLQALAARYARLAARGEAPLPGFGPAQIGFTLVLDAEGRVVTVDDERTAEGRRLGPRVIEAPLPPKRTVAVASGAFWDKTSYVLGRTAIDTATSPSRQARDAARMAQEHDAFKARHEALLAGTKDVGCRALLAFLRNWAPADYEGLPHAEAMLDQNVTFRLHGEPGFIHDRPTARAALMAEADAAAGSGDVGMCLVTGAMAPIARLHPSIKGVPGAQSSGAALVSFNLDAFNSYGKAQGSNGPVSEMATHAYATALNGLISAANGTDPKTGHPRYRNRVGLGNDTVVFWAETDEAEQIAEAFFALPARDEPPNTALVGKVLEDMQAGRLLRDAAPSVDPATRVYVLGLSPNAARLSVRFWVDQTLGDLATRFAEHWADLRLEPAPRIHLPPLWALLYELALQRKAENVPAHLAGELTRAILTGGRYPASLLTQALMRMRADGQVTPLRTALVKAVLTRRARHTCAETRRHDLAHPDWRDSLVSLDRQEPNAGYRLGRLFAVLDTAQYVGLGRVNAGVKDRSFGAAAATPGRVFPLLLRGAQNHLSAARKKGKQGRAIRLDREIAEILGGFAGAQPFPPTLSLEDQGRFVIGFYHQAAELRVPRASGEVVDDRDDNGDAATDANEES